LLEVELPPIRLGESLELEEELGRGGMGTVFRARHTRLGRTVAVKLLAPELAHDAEARARFEREARALAQLSQPNIVQVHDFGEAEGQCFLVMEYVQGRPLSSCLPLPPAQAVRVAIELCEALAAAHAQGIVHRDVKPGNVFLDAAGRAKLGDFGIARFTGVEQAGFTVTSAGSAAGTPAYLAPEVLAGAPPDPRADLYSLGVLLHQMLTGALPGATLGAMPGGLARVVRRALAPDPSARFATANELRGALTALRIDERSDDLPEDERFFLRGAALLSTAAAAMGVWAGVVSLTPKIVAADAVQPLTEIVSRTLADGRVVSLARFEVGPILLAMLGIAVAFTGLGVLRRHWRMSGLDSPTPMRPLRQSPVVFALGLVGGGTYALRRLLESRGSAGLLSHFPPLLGGLFEAAALFVFFTGMLQAWRTARPLAREPLLFVGLLLLVVPPAGELWRYLAHWQP